MINLNIIPEWRQAWRMLSIQVATLYGVWISLNPEDQKLVLDVFNLDEAYLPGIFVVAVIIGRLISQPKIEEAHAKDEVEKFAELAPKMTDADVPSETIIPSVDEPPKVTVVTIESATTPEVKRIPSD